MVDAHRWFDRLTMSGTRETIGGVYPLSQAWERVRVRAMALPSPYFTLTRLAWIPAILYKDGKDEGLPGCNFEEALAEEESLCSTENNWLLCKGVSWLTTATRFLASLGMTAIE
jgi:hypothetical protein